MKIKVFNSTNTKSERISRGEPAIAFDKKGMFRINKPACEMLKLKGGGQIEFLQDEEKPTSWYITTPKKDGFVVKELKNLTPGVAFNNSKLSAEILKCFNGQLEGKTSCKMKLLEPIQFEKRTLFPLQLV